MNITITIPDGKKDAIISAFAVVYGYETEVLDGDGNLIPNPQTKKDFALEQLRDFVRSVYKSQKVTEADDARITAQQEADMYTDDITIGA